MSRADHDAPATMIAASVGVVLLLIGVPLTFWQAANNAGQSEDFRVTWSQTSGSAKAASPNNAATITVTSGLVAAVTVTSTACTDSADTQGGALQNPASVTVTVKRKVGTQTTTVGSPVTYQCASVPNPIFLNLTPAPDIGIIAGSDLGEAAANLEARVASQRFTGDYIVEVTSSRAPNQIPPQVPVGQPTLTATVELKVTTWTATVAPQEVAK